MFSRALSRADAAAAVAAGGASAGGGGADLAELAAAVGGVSSSEAADRADEGFRGGVCLPSAKCTDHALSAMRVPTSGLSLEFCSELLATQLLILNSKWSCQQNRGPSYPVLMRRAALGEKSPRLNLVSRGVPCFSVLLLFLMRMRSPGLSAAMDALASGHTTRL